MRARGRIVLGVLLCAPLLGGSTWLHRNDGDVAKGQDAYGRGSYAVAAKHFRRALSGAASRDVAQFNLGTALCEEARQENSESERARLLQLGMVALRSALDADEESLRVSALYNLGNAQAWAGDYASAVGSFKDVLRQAPDHLEASHNLEVAQLGLSREAPKGGEAGGAGDPTVAGKAAPDKTAPDKTAPEGAGQGENSQAGAEHGGGASDAGEGSGESGAAGAGETEAGEPRAMQAEPRALSQPGSLDDSSIDEKLRALERRSGELRRARVLRRSKALRSSRRESEHSN